MSKSKFVPGNYVLLKSITGRRILLYVKKVNSSGYYVEPVLKKDIVIDPDNPPDPCFIPFEYEHLMINVGNDLDSVKLLYGKTDE